MALLANAFNRMADRIQELITSHKELTHTVSYELRTSLARIRFNMEMMKTITSPTITGRKCTHRRVRFALHWPHPKKFGPITQNKAYLNRHRESIDRGQCANRPAAR